MLAATTVVVEVVAAVAAAVVAQDLGSDEEKRLGRVEHHLLHQPAGQ